MASLSMSGKGSVEDIADMLSEEIQKSAMSCQLVDEVRCSVGGYPVRVMVFDKYYMRVKNRASLTVVVTGENGTVRVDVVASGGGQGAIFSFSWGAEENFASTVENILRSQGFQ
jgi:hypothetical protein